MTADDFRDYMLFFLFLRYLSDNYEVHPEKELKRDYPKLKEGDRAPLAAWYKENKRDVPEFEKVIRRKVHYVSKPQFLWSSITEMARTQDDELLNALQAGFDYIETESFASSFKGLLSAINLSSKKLGKNYADRNTKPCSIITKIAEGLKEITENDFNLNISRYISTAFSEKEIDLAQVNADLVTLEKKIKEETRTHNKFLKELGATATAVIAGSGFKRNGSWPTFRAYADHF